MAIERDTSKIRSSGAKTNMNNSHLLLALLTGLVQEVIEWLSAAKP